MKNIQLLALTLALISISSCGLLRNQNASMSLKERVPTGSIIKKASFQIELVPLNGYDAWSWYEDSKNPDALTMVTGLSYDKYDNHYATYAIKAKPRPISKSIRTREAALEYSQRKYHWKVNPSALTNKNNELCIGDSKNDYTTEEDIIYVYQAICFNFQRNIAVEFHVSGIKSKAKPGSDFSAFTGRLFSTYKSI